MEKEHRISAGAIIIRNNKVLLARYTNRSGGSFLVGPGGGVLEHEGINEAVVREVQEETGLMVRPGKILFVEDLLSRRYRMIKIWMLCHVSTSRIRKTQGAIEEGITEVAWYTRNNLDNEIVHPSVLLSQDWTSFFLPGWETQYMELKKADF